MYFTFRVQCRAQFVALRDPRQDRINVCSFLFVLDIKVSVYEAKASWCKKGEFQLFQKFLVPDLATNRDISWGWLCKILMLRMPHWFYESPCALFRWCSSLNPYRWLIFPQYKLHFGEGAGLSLCESLVVEIVYQSSSSRWSLVVSVKQEKYLAAGIVLKRLIMRMVH